MEPEPKYLRYNTSEKKKFHDFFEHSNGAPTRRAGRPKKKKRGRPQKKQAVEAAAPPAVSRKKFKAVLTKNMLGTMTMARRSMPKRVNWNQPGHREYRERIAKSWRTQSDLYREGEIFTSFCDRVGIHWNTLRRFLKVTENNKAPVYKKRGRKPMLSQETMEHICEGWFV